MHLPTPAMPSQAEIEEHRASGHAQYRSWCDECVEGFGREWPHMSAAIRRFPFISCDYLFLNHNVSEEEQEAASRILVAYCGATKSLFAHVVPRKGADDGGYIVTALKQDVLWLGHAKVIIRSDNEPALLQVVRQTVAALKMEGVDAADEGSVPRDPQTNGAIENAVKLLKGTLRANLLSFERMIRARVPLDHPIIAWLV